MMPSKARAKDLIDMHRKICLEAWIETTIQEREHKILSNKLESLSGISVSFGNTPRLQRKVTSTSTSAPGPAAKHSAPLYYKWRWVDLEPV